MSAPARSATRPPSRADVIRDFLAREAVHAQAVKRSAEIDWEIQRRRFLADRIDQTTFDRATNVLATARTELAYVSRLLNAYPRST